MPTPPPQAPPHADAHILVVDDNEVNLVLVERSLRAGGYRNITLTDDPSRALEVVERKGIDLLVSDLHMPRMDGLELIRRVQAATPAGTFLPIIVITADASDDAEKRVLSQGAHDYIAKPIRSNQVLLRVGNLLRTRGLYLELQRQAELLELRVRQRTAELEASRIDLLERLSLAAEYRDDATARHTERVGVLAASLAREIGLPEERVHLIRHAAPLHDVGKIGVPDQILRKNGRLSEGEYRAMQAHVEVGIDLLSKGDSELMAVAEVIIRSHHERWDGSGYPQGLAGAAIPIEGRIVAIADVFDVLVSDRPYKRAWKLDEALSEMRRQRGHWFEPELLDAFVAMIEADPGVLDVPARSEGRAGATERSGPA